jgi:hypothetical protein
MVWTLYNFTHCWWQWKWYQTFNEVRQLLYLVVCLSSGTFAIRHLIFPTSWDIQQKFMVPKYFCLLNENLSNPISCTIRYISLIPWCVGLNRFHCILSNDLLLFVHSNLNGKWRIRFIFIWTLVIKEEHLILVVLKQWWWLQNLYLSAHFKLITFLLAIYIYTVK